MRLFDRIFSILLILGGVGHTLGSLRVYYANQMMLMWALCASVLVFLMAAVNLIRAGRPGDKSLGWICLTSGACWLGASFRFGQLIGNIFDPRPLIFALITLGLCAFSVRTILGPKRKCL